MMTRCAILQAHTSLFFGDDKLPLPPDKQRIAKSRRSTNSFASSGSNPTMFQNMLQQQYELDRATKMERMDRETMARVELINSQKTINDDDDVFTEATPLASKVPVVDYQVHHENNKPYYKIIRSDGTHKLFLSFITLLKKFYREDLKTLWKLIKERFESIEPKNFSDDFLLNILKIMFEKPNVEANVWRDQKSIYGLAKVKSWKLFKSYGVHIITLTTTQMILLVEKKYPLTRFTLEQMLNNVRLKF
nr:hypothetical protein [Tanacetum cinerariifolium]